MATAIEKERKRKSTAKIYIILGSIFYVYFLLTYLHSAAIMKNNPRMNFIEAFNTGMTSVFTHPLEIFPIGGMTILYSVLFTLAVGTVLIMLGAEKALKKHDNPDTVNGEAHLMNQSELEAYKISDYLEHFAKRDAIESTIYEEVF